MLQVIGAGLGRTGTHSLGLAFEKLGFGPCYNIREVTKNPGHVEVWNRAIDNKPIDWGFLFESYRSVVEWPAVAFLPQLIQYFPEAKIVLTLRDPDSWYESASATIFEGLELSAHNPDPIRRQSSAIFRRLILESTFGGRYREKEYAIEVYKQHHRKVVEMVPEHRLLQYDVKEGWEPLCEFLKKPIPDEPFPWLNERTEFLTSEPAWARKIKRKRAE